MKRRTTTFGPSAVALAGVLGLAGAVPAGAVEDENVDPAITWLATQQEPGGGFGADTGGVILSLAEAGQLAEDWVPADGLAAVETVVGPDGRTPIDALDDAAEAPGILPSEAARLIAGAVVPLGLDPTDVDPRDDSAAPVDLVASVEAGAGPGGDYAGLPLEDQATVALGLAAATYAPPPPEEEPPDAPAADAAARAEAADAAAAAVPGGLVQALEAAQGSDGLWRATGAAADSPGDPAVTGLVLQALGTSGVPMTDFTVISALTGLARSMSPLGGWSAEGVDEVDGLGTAATSLGLATLGLDPSDPCWRDVLHPGWSGVRYNDPVESLRGSQGSDGSIGGSVAATTAAIQLMMGSSPLLTIGLPAEPPELECPEPTPEEALVHSIYYPVLGRLADTGGTAFHAAQLLAETATPASIAHALVTSREYARHAVHAAFADLGRRADPAAVAYFSTYVPGRQHAIRGRVLGSAEFYRKAGGTDAGFVNAAYQHVLGRAPRPDEAAAMATALASGRTRTSIATSLVRSPEALARQANDLVVSVLGRPADLVDIATVSEQLRTVGVEQVLEAMVGSEEFALGPE